MDKDVRAEITALWNKINDIGRRQSDYATAKVAAITPYTETKTGYIGDTEVTFDTEEKGSLTVYVEDSEGNYPDYSVERTGNRITVTFEPLEYVTTITISII